MGLYPDQGSVTHPDDVGERRMPPRNTHVASDDETFRRIEESNPSVVKYGGAAGGQTFTMGRDLGQALRTMGKHRELYPDSPVKFHATYE